MLRRNILILTLGTVCVALLGGAFLLGSADEPQADGVLLFTEIPAPPGEATHAAIDWRYPERSRIVALDTQTPERPPVVLTEDFQAARAPEVSFDGRRILFAGKKDTDAAWQIWEMAVDGSGLRQITDGLAGCTDPAYLPHDGIVFSARLSETDARHVLFTVNRDGTDAQRITFHPESDVRPTLLQDGRLIAASGAQDTGATSLLGMRYDGTKAELLYRNDQGSRLTGKAWETADRRIVFVESMDDEVVGGALVAVSLSRPLHSRVDLAPDAAGAFHSALPGPPEQFMVSYRTDDASPFALYVFRPTEQQVGRRVYGEAAYHAVEPVWAAARPEPMGFVSIVDAQAEAGWLYGLDANHSTLLPADATRRGARLRVQGIDGLLGEVPLAADGSFYLEVPPDTPLRFETVDAAGEPVLGPSAWIWVRPNEQRGCIGCHEDREQVPDNRVPLAITRPPVSLLRSDAFAATYPGDGETP